MPGRATVTWGFVAVVAVALGLALPAGAVPAAPVAPGFSDVDAGDPFAADIAWLADEGITTGYPDGTFRPTGSVNRGSMAAFLYRIVNGATAPAPCTAAAFDDVLASHPFCPHITWLAQTGITTGYVDGTFRPAAAVTRGAMAAFLYRLSTENAPPPTCAADPFNDVRVGDPFCGQIQWLADQEVTTGWPDGTFRPGLPIARQAMAAFLHRVVDKGLVPGGEPPADPLAPQVTIDTPTSGVLATGTMEVRASWSSTADVVSLDLLVDGVVTMTVAAEPFTLSWDTTTAAEGARTLTVRATDAEGRSGTSADVAVVVLHGPNPLDLLEQHRADGTVTPEDYARFAVYRWFEPELVPEAYRVPEGMTPGDLTVPLLGILYGDPELDPAVRDELLDYFKGDNPDDLPQGPLPQEVIDAALAPFAPDAVPDAAPPAAAVPDAAPPDDGSLQAAGRAVGRIDCMQMGGEWIPVPDPLERQRLGLPCAYRTDVAILHYDRRADAPQSGLDDITDVLNSMLEPSTSGPDGGANGVPDAIDAVYAAYMDSWWRYNQLGFGDIEYTIVWLGEKQGMSLPNHVVHTLAPNLNTRPSDPLPHDRSIYLMRHELFHQFQYAFTDVWLLADDYADDEQRTVGWWLEATTEWAAHKVAETAAGTRAQSRWYQASDECGGSDDLPCYAMNLKQHLGTPGLPLATFADQWVWWDELPGVDVDYTSPQYGAFIFAEYLEERFGTAIIRETWQAAEAAQYEAEHPAVAGIAHAVGIHNADLATVVADYHRANYTIGPSYDDTDATRWARLLDDRRPGRTHRAVVPGVRGQGRQTIGAGGAAYLELERGPRDDGGVTMTVKLEVVEADLDPADLWVRLVPMEGYPRVCDTGENERSWTAGADSLEIYVMMPAGCPDATLIVSHRDPDAIDPGLQTLTLKYSYQPSRIRTIAFSMFGPDVAGPDRAVENAGVYGGYVLNDDGTVSYWSEWGLTDVGLTNVKQIAGAGRVGGMDRVFAIQADGDVHLVQGLEKALVDELNGTELMATDYQSEAVYALDADAGLRYVFGGSYAPVAGAADIADVAGRTWYDYPTRTDRGSGFAVKSDGTVLYLTEATATPVPGLGFAESVEVDDWGDGYVTHADGTVTMLARDTPLEPWPVAGVTGVVEIIPIPMDYSMALTDDGRLYYLTYNPFGDGPLALDSGLVGVDEVGRVEADPSWVLVDGEVFQTSVDESTWTVSVTSTGLTDVVEIGEAAYRYALHEDGTVSSFTYYPEAPASLPKVPAIANGDHLICSSRECFVTYD